MPKIFVARRVAVQMAVAAQTGPRTAKRLVVPMVVAVTTALVSVNNVDLLADNKKNASCF